MKNNQLLRRAVICAVLLPALMGLGGSRALAYTVSEGANLADFPNNTPGPAYVLTNVGTFTFSGTVSSADNQDRFDVTIAPGMQLSQITKDASGANVPSFFLKFYAFAEVQGLGPGSMNLPGPMQGGPYSFLANVNAGAGTLWQANFIVTAAPDYAVTNDGTSIVITDMTGNSETLTVTNSSFGNLKFIAPGRFFSVNGATPRVGDSGELFYLGLNSVTVNAGGGSDVIDLNLGNYSAFYPSLTVNGGTGNDTVNINSTIFFAPDNSLDIDLQNDEAAPGADAVNVAGGVHVFASGTGAITVRCSKNVAFASGSGLQTLNGDLTVEANQQTPARTGDFVGVNLNGATLKSMGAGYVIVNGTGGNGTNGYQLGVQVINGAQIIGGTNGYNNQASGYVIVNGTGGASTNFVNRGVTVYGAGSVITSSNGPVYVSGYAGPVGSYFGIGVSVLSGGEISAGSTGSTLGNVNVTGVGAGTNGSGFNQGLELGGTGSRILSKGGNVNINGTAGVGGSFGIYLTDNANITTPATGGHITFISDSISLDSGTSLATLNPASVVQIFPQTYGTVLNLGGADAPGVLGLTDAELDRIATANMIVGLGNCPINITAPISLSTVTNLTLLPGAGGAVVPVNAGVDISLASDGLVRIPFGSLACAINGPVPDSGFNQYNVAGKVDLTGTTLVLSGSYTGAIGDSFTIINNDGNEPIIGNFKGLPEGAFLPLNGEPAQIHYNVGTGNDVALVRTRPGLVATGPFTNGGWRLAGVVSASGAYLIQATTNFINWTNLGMATGDLSGRLTFTDTNAYQFPRRFYRAAY